MPLKRGKSAKTIGANIREMLKAGHPADQSVAAAYDMANKKRKKK
jgi:hypothetical protein